MIIVDLSQVMFANLHSSLGNHTNTTIEVSIFRHMVLNTIRSLNTRFREEYGELVIACDDRNYWRKDFFPYYKASRKTDREKSDLDWVAVYNCLNTVREELKEYFPYRVVQVPKAEADDVIATLAIHAPYESDNILDEALGERPKVLIVSGDKDFMQLQVYRHIKQYDPIRKRFLKPDDPKRFLKEHILKGDRGDGVPNFLSPDDVFMIKGARQKPLTEKRMLAYIDLDPSQIDDNELKRNYFRNKQLVDLSMIPEHIQKAVLDKYNEQAGKSRAKIFPYFIQFKLKNMMSSIGDF